MSHVAGLGFWRGWLAAGLLAAAVPGFAESHPCEAAPVVIETPERGDALALCTVAERAARVVRGMGLVPRQGVRVRIVDRLASGNLGHAMAEFHAPRNEIWLLDFPSALKAAPVLAPAFGLPMTKGLWHSYLVHELAHAAAEVQFAGGVPRFTASEYIAGVAQIASLPPSLRSDVLLKLRDTAPFGQPAEITALLYLMDPCRFMVKAYLHYGRRGSGPAFVRRILDDGLPDG